MKIAFVSQPWELVNPPAQGGSLVIWTYQVTRRLSDKMDIVVYARRQRKQPKARWVENIHFRWKNLPLEDHWVKLVKLLERIFQYPLPKRPFFSSPFFYLGYILLVAFDLRRQGCDIVHIQNLSQYVPIVRALNPRIRIILSMQCEWLSQLDRNMVRSRLEKTDLVIGCSDYITERIRERFPAFAERCSTVLNGVDTAAFLPQPSKIQLDGRDPVNGTCRVLFVGRVSPEKGVHVLLDAFRIVGERLPGAHLDIVGPVGSAPYEYMTLVSDDEHVRGLSVFYQGRLKRSDYFTSLQARIAPQVADRIHFVGPVPHSRIKQYYQQAALLVNPSLTEAFGMSLVEGMASGIPVIATRVGGMPGIVLDQISGLLVAPNDAGALAAAILSVLIDERLRQSMGERGRSAIGQYTWDAIAESVATLYSSLVARRQ